MISVKRYAFIACLCAAIMLPVRMLNGAASSFEVAPAFSTADTATPTHTLLMFMDDTEIDKIGAVSGDFITALTQEAAPLLVSATLIDNIKTAKPLIEKDPATLRQIVKEIKKKKFDEATPEEEETYKSIILSLIDVNTPLQNAWIIKAVNPSLYLLLPKKFIQKKGLSDSEVEAYLTQDAFTKAEQTIGLKVNHLKTVDLAAIHKPESPNYYIDYLIPSLKDIILTRKDYHDLNAVGPNWAFFIDGHGYTDAVITGLSVEDFKHLLEFLEHVPTAFFMYVSCYAGGKNIELLYKDAMAGIDKTYDFPIVTDALTDAPTYGTHYKIILEQNKLTAKPSFDFNCFVQQVEAGEDINYEAAVRCVTHEKTDINARPQIRFPGLPWFSILDMNRVASIGSVFAKARTAPLNIATFFAKKGTTANPEGILLYAYDIPFELIINTTKSKKIDKKTGQPSPEACYVPTFVSMIPKDAVHHIKKISSSCNTIDKILSAFYIDKLFWHKIFIIDEVNASFSPTMSNLLSNNSQTSGTLTNVIVDVADEVVMIYFTYDSQEYYAEEYIDETNPPALATDEQKDHYHKLLAEYGPESATQPPTSIEVTPELMQQLREDALQTFAAPMDHNQAEQEIIALLDRMPNNTALHIPAIHGNVCPPENYTCWLDFLNHITNYRPAKTHKVLWFDELQAYSYPLYIDLIIEITPKESRVFHKMSGTDPQPTKMSRRIAETNISEYPNYTYLTEDYAPAYADLLAYFDGHLTLDKPKEEHLIEKKPIRKQLTPERVAQIKAMLERKISKPE